MTLSRVPDARWRGPIGAALEVLPQRIKERLAHVQFVCGVNPVFAGIHHFTDALDGRPYRETAHCCHPWHIDGPAARRVTTIVLPVPVLPSHIVHELGHALDATIGFKHVAEPVTDYAGTNRNEAFAEAFTAWRYYYGDQDVAAQDKATLHLFKEMADG